MLRPIVWIFLLCAVMFAGLHLAAVQLSLYWYFWWFDIFMHSTGGALVTFGLFALGTFSRIKRQPRALEVVAILLVVVSIWEVFEWYAGLYTPATYIFDTSKDMLLGFTAGMLSYGILKKILKP